MNEKIFQETVKELFTEATDGMIHHEVASKVEKELIILALMRAYGNKSLAARLLGVNRNTMRIKMRAYSLEGSQYKFPGRGQ